MFASFVVTALLSSPLFVLADPTPSAPGPGDVYKQGGTCHTAWDADTAPNSPWKVMNIELMSGSNFDMKPVTTLTTKPVDGTVSGVLDFPCPEVNPYSAIYFFQYSCPTCTEKTWSTRFTIADATGKSTPPANPTQPGTGDKIPWGIGTLVDQSKVVPPPVGGGGNSASGASASTASNSTTSASAKPSMVTSVSVAPSTPTGSSSTGTDSASKSAVNTNTNASSTPNSGALATVVDTRFLAVLAGVAAFFSL